MADVVLGYVALDQRVASRIATALSESGISVMSSAPATADDREVPLSPEFAAVDCVVVVWSEHSVKNEIVLGEAEAARSREALVSVMIGKPRLPIGFRDVWYANLTDWNGSADTDAFQVLRRLVEARLQQARSSTGPRGANTRTRPVPRSTAERTPTIFLCYRRDDSQDAAGRLHDRLATTYGAESVFMDIESVPLGVDFVDHVKIEIARCHAVIVMIGRQWLTLETKRGTRRLDDPEDLARIEIAAALRQRVPVIPVLVQNASMPDRDELPDDLRLLTRRNGIALRHDQWRESVARLLKELDPIMKAKG